MFSFLSGVLLCHRHNLFISISLIRFFLGLYFLLKSHQCRICSRVSFSVLVIIHDPSCTLFLSASFISLIPVLPFSSSTLSLFSLFLHPTSPHLSTHQSNPLPNPSLVPEIPPRKPLLEDLRPLRPPPARKTHGPA